MIRFLIKIQGDVPQYTGTIVMKIKKNATTNKNRIDQCTQKITKLPCVYSNSHKVLTTLPTQFVHFTNFIVCHLLTSLKSLKSIQVKWQHTTSTLITNIKSTNVLEQYKFIYTLCPQKPRLT